MLSYSSCGSCLALYSFSCDSFVFRTEYSLCAVRTTFPIPLFCCLGRICVRLVLFSNLLTRHADSSLAYMTLSYAPVADVFIDAEL